MAERFGRVVYWIGCIVAALFVLMAVYDAPQQGYGAGVMLFIAGMTAVIWGAGRAVLFVLSGK